jgi:hypothetical protein
LINASIDFLPSKTLPCFLVSFSISTEFEVTKEFHSFLPVKFHFIFFIKEALGNKIENFSFILGTSIPPSGAILMFTSISSCCFGVSFAQTLV